MEFFISQKPRHIQNAVGRDPDVHPCTSSSEGVVMGQVVIKPYANVTVAYSVNGSQHLLFLFTICLCNIRANLYQLTPLSTPKVRLQISLLFPHPHVVRLPSCFVQLTGLSSRILSLVKMIEDVATLGPVNRPLPSPAGTLQGT